MNVSSGTETRRRELTWLFVILLVALATDLFFLRFEKIIIPDEGYYLRMGQYLHEGGKYGDFDFKPTKHKGQPLVPFLFSFSGATGSKLIAQGRGISIAAGLFGLFLFHFCARFFLKPREALISTFTLAISPFYIQASIWAMTHSFLMLFLIAGLYFSLKLETKKTSAAVFTGVLFWAAYMVRVEAVLFVLAFSLGLFLFSLPTAGRGTWAKVKTPLLIFGVFFSLSLPVWVRIHQETGIWQLTWTKGLGAGGVFEWRWTRPLNEPLSAGNFLLNYCRYLKKGFFLLPEILPLPIWILSAFGTAEILSGRPALASPFWRLLLFALIPFAIYPALAAEDPRFYYPMLMFALIPAGAGLRPLGGLTAVLFEPVWWGKFFQKIPRRVYFFLTVLTLFLPGYVDLATNYRQEPMEQKEMGEWLAGHRMDSYRMLGSDQRTCFYAGTPCSKFIPIEHAVAAGRERRESLEDFLNRSGISVIAMDTRYGKKLYPEFEPMLQQLSSAGLQQVSQASYGGEKVTLYDWRPESHAPKQT